VPPIVDYRPAKTLWDYMVFIMGAIVASSIALLNQKNEERRKQTDIIVATDLQRETALQNYLDKMTELLLDKDLPLRKSKVDDEVRMIARTRTLATLRTLDPNRKGLLVRVLYEAGLINKEQPIVDLDGANLSKAYLKGASLQGAC